MLVMNRCRSLRCFILHWWPCIYSTVEIAWMIAWTFSYIVIAIVGPGGNCVQKAWNLWKHLWLRLDPKKLSYDTSDPFSMHRSKVNRSEWLSSVLNSTLSIYIHRSKVNQSGWLSSLLNSTLSIYIHRSKVNRSGWLSSALNSMLFIFFFRKKMARGREMRENFSLAVYSLTVISSNSSLGESFAW